MESYNRQQYLAYCARKISDNIRAFIILCIVLFSSATHTEAAISNFAISGSRSITLESLWEKNLNSIPAYMNDAYEDDHGVFMIGDIVYSVIIPYRQNNPVLRRFNITTDEILDPIEFNEFSSYNIEIKTNVVKDDAGHICLVAINTHKPKTSINQNAPLTLSVKCYTDLSCENYVESTVATALKDNNNMPAFWNNLEIGNIRGDATSNFQVIIDGWQCNSENVHWPTSTVYNFENRELKSIYGIHFDVEETTDGTAFNRNDFGIGDYYYYISASDVTDDIKVVQGFRMTAPLLVKYTERYTTEVGLLGSAYRHFVISDCLTENIPHTEGTPCPEGHYGAEVIKIGDETLLLTTSRSYHEQGPKFKLSCWTGDKETFDGLTELTEFPEDDTFTFSSDSKYYSFGRPLFEIVPEIASVNAPQNSISAIETPVMRAGETDVTNNPSSVKLVTYVPGSGIGVYRVSLKNEETVSGVDKPTDDSAPIQFRRDGDYLRILNAGNPTSITPCGEILTLDGRIIRKVSSSEISNGIPVAHLPKGCYILRLGNRTLKLVL